MTLKQLKVVLIDNNHIDNHHNFLGMTPERSVELAIKLYSPLSDCDYGIFADGKFLE